MLGVPTIRSRTPWNPGRRLSARCTPVGNRRRSETTRRFSIRSRTCPHDDPNGRSTHHGVSGIPYDHPWRSASSIPIGSPEQTSSSLPLHPLRLPVVSFFSRSDVWLGVSMVVPDTVSLGPASLGIRRGSSNRCPALHGWSRVYRPNMPWIGRVAPRGAWKLIALCATPVVLVRRRYHMPEDGR